MRGRRGGHDARSRSQSGAAAVEFALVSLIFFPLLFGMVDYGLFFNDSLNARQGVREGARLGVVGTFQSGSSCTSGTDLDKLRCTTKRQIDAISGPAYVRVTAPDGWTKGKRLLVCAMVRADGVTGMVPMPNKSVITTRTSMSIESGTALSGGTTSEDTPPSGHSWSWCT